MSLVRHRLRFVDRLLAPYEVHLDAVIFGIKETGPPKTGFSAPLALDPPCS